MGTWKLVVNFLLPPPLILTVLLLIPLPGVIKKGLLIFTKNFLFCNMAPNIKLVHLALLLTGISFVASATRTYQMAQMELSDGLTANQRTAALARRWREERNFWIACLTFLLWGLLYRFYSLLLDHVATKDRVRQLETVIARHPAVAAEVATRPLVGGGSINMTRLPGGKANGAAGKANGAGGAVLGAAGVQPVQPVKGSGAPVEGVPSAPPFPKAGFEVEGKKVA